MIETIQRNASHAATNIIEGNHRMTAEAIKAERTMLNGFEDLLERLKTAA